MTATELQQKFNTQFCTGNCANCTIKKELIEKLSGFNLVNNSIKNNEVGMTLVRFYFGQLKETFNFPHFSKDIMNSYIFAVPNI